MNLSANATVNAFTTSTTGPIREKPLNESSRSMPKAFLDKQWRF